MVKFKIGDRVRFKPEHYHYRDRLCAPDEFVIVYIDEDDGDCVYWLPKDSTGKAAYPYRLELVDRDGPW